MSTVRQLHPGQDVLPWYRDPILRRNILTLTFLYLGAFSQGYDGSVLNGLQSLSTWNDYFNSPSGNRLSIYGALGNLCVVPASLLFAVLNNGLGRRPSIAISCVVIIIGGVLGAAAQNEAMFLVGRAVVGPGGSLAVVSTSLLIAELLHPRIRAVGAALVLAFYYVGSVVAAWTSFGVVAGDWNSSWSWRLPTLLQTAGPVLLLVAVIFWCPESPRWLIAHGRANEARRILAQHHAGGDEQDPLVEAEMEEISNAIEFEKANKTGLRTAFATPGNRRRLAIVFVVAAGSQLNGASLFSYYLTPVLKQVGVTDAVQQSGVNAGMSIWNLGCAMVGAALSERIGRRPLWLYSTIAMFLCFTVLLGTSAGYAKTGSSGIGIANVVFIFLAYACYNMSWCPMSYSYPVECLPYSMRASVMALFATVQYTALAFVQWVNPIGLAAGGWKYYWLFWAILLLLIFAIYFLFPETKGLSLEEIACVFDKIDVDAQYKDDEKNSGASACAEMVVDEKL